MHTLNGSMTLHVQDMMANRHQWLFWRNHQGKGYYFPEQGAYHMECPASWQPVAVDS